MRISLSRRNLLGLIIVAVAICASAFTLFAAKPFLAHADAKTLEGTWNIQTYFISGSLKGQTKLGTITYAADGTLTSETDGIAGVGTWYKTSKLDFHYQFVEQIYQNGHNVGSVTVVENGSLSNNAKTDIASGAGTLFINTSSGPIPTGANGNRVTQQRIKHS